MYSDLFDIPPPENDKDALLLSQKIKEWINKGRPKPGEEVRQPEGEEIEESEPEEEEQEKLPLHSIHTAFKFVTADFNFSRYPENEKNISDGLSEAIAEATEFSVKETKLISVRQYKEGESVVIFGYSRLEDESKAAMFEVELKNGLETGKIGKFTLSRGCIYCKHYRNVHKRNCLYVHIYIFKGVVTNMRGVEANSVIHISIQFWNEPWIYGMDNEKTEIR